ncbi:MAG: HD domain-containing protein [Elusimicrobiales bacterium]|nr:HD domain-containing protein [Elusimicrobiales bacterium]
MRFSDLRKLKEEPRRPAPEKKAMTPAPSPVQVEPPPAAAPALASVQAPAAEVSGQAEPAPSKPDLRRRQPGPRLMNSQEPLTASPASAVTFSEHEPRAREVYSRLLDQAGAFLKAADQPYCEKYEAVAAACGLVSETLKTNPALLGFTAYSTADDYLRGHTANTVVLALAMGVQAGLEPAELRLLGFCAMAHDIGMTEYSSLYNSETRLGDDEFAEMALHAEAGAAKLDRIVDLDYKIKERARRIVLQTHERADGSGYPDHASDEDIDPLAQLIAIADTYEAMTHPRAWRGPIAPPDAVKELIEKEGRGFNAGAVKLLISVLSIFPPGSLVRLSTGETARVLAVNRGSLTRPLVEKLLDPHYEPAAPVRLDLLAHPLLTIERTTGLDEVALHNPKYAAKLELARWWVEW